MCKTRNFVLLVLISIAGLWTFWEMRIYANSRGTSAIGPDVIVGDIYNTLRWGSLNNESSYSIGTISCNIGDEPMDWQSNTNLHPVISQNLYRVKDGRIELLGMSWLKHGFAVAAGHFCGTCNDFSSDRLGVNCSDPYSAQLNGNQNRLGPRSEVNAATGIFSFPHRNLNQPRNILDGRIRVLNSEINPIQNPGATYFVESQYIHPQDAAAGNGNNNASYREITVTGSGGVFELNLVGTTMQQQPAILAWKALYPEVQVYDVDIPGDGRVMVGVLTTPDNAGGFHNEIAIQNLNSHRSIRSLDLKFDSNSITNPGFRDVDYQQEPYSGINWSNSINGNEMSWSTDTYDTNPNANALRWNTLYSFWCDSDTRPWQLTMGIFRPGTPTEVTVNLTQSCAANGTLIEGAGQVNDYTQTCGSDDVYWAAHGATLVFQVSDPVVQFELIATAPADFNGNMFSIDIEASKQSNSGNLNLRALAFNYASGDYVALPGVMPLAATDAVQNFLLPVGADPLDFVDDQTDEIRLLLQTLQTSGLANNRTRLDEVRFNIQ